MPADEGRRRLLAAMAGGAAIAALPACAGAGDGGTVEPVCTEWTAWTQFLARHVQEDGRVVDFHTPQQHSTSEGQSYTLFFALVANDRPVFDRVLAWTRDNLSGGDVGARLPAWQWGRAEDGSWRILDPNAASDADLWIAYALLEAGRLWSAPEYTELAERLLARIVEGVVVETPELGAVLLPGPTGFVHEAGLRLNPSYVPLQLFRRFAAEYPSGPWGALVDSSLRLMAETAPRGFSPDWTLWTQEGWEVDPVSRGIGSYDAIRVYLWAGMLDPEDPARERLLAALHGPAGVLAGDGVLPERVDTVTGTAEGAAPLGFSAALLPYLHARGDDALLAGQSRLVDATIAQPASAEALPYYERTLVLFGGGWLERRYAFARSGRLITRWDSSCGRF